MSQQLRPLREFSFRLIFKRMSEHRQATIIGAMLLLFLAIRLIHLTADPPIRLPNGRDCTELFVEGAAKSQEARNKALFGQWQTHPLDNYQFWRVQSPVWVYPLTLVFKLTGVGYAQLRLFSVFTAMIGVFCLLYMAARRFSGWPLVMCGIFVTFSYCYIFYTRAGLLEPLVNSFFASMVLFLLLSVDNTHWLIAAQLSLLMAFLTKQTGIVLLPVYLIFMVWSIHNAVRRAETWRKWMIPVATFGIILIFLVFYIQQDEYWRSIRWNFGHFLYDKPKNVRAPISADFFHSVFKRLVSLEMWSDQIWMTMPTALPLIVVEVVRILYRFIKERRCSAWDALAFLWFFSILASLFATPLKPMRFFILLIPPGALLAAGGLSTLLNKLTQYRTRWPKELVLGLLFALFGATHGAWWLDWAVEPTYHIVDTGKNIAEKLGDRDAVVVGRWASPFVLETKYKNYYVKHHFNRSGRVLRKLGITHLLVKKRRDWSHYFVKRAFPDFKQRSKSLEKYKLWKRYRMELLAFDAKDKKKKKKSSFSKIARSVHVK